MRKWVFKYVLTLSLLLMAFGHLHSHFNHPAVPAVKDAFSHIDFHRQDTDKLVSLLSAYDANKTKFTTDNNDNEEELSGPAKKILKTGGCFISSFYSHGGYLSLSYRKCFSFIKHCYAYSPQRLFIKFRVIRL